MRLGGPIFAKVQGAEEWVQAHREMGYGAAYCPIDAKASADTVRSYREAAQAAGLIIAEVGAWSNPLGADPQERREAITHCKNQLALAEALHARCCVNIAGSRGEQWDGPHPENFSEDTFDRIVQTVREIIDAVKPDHTSYTLFMTTQR